MQANDEALDAVARGLWTSLRTFKEIRVPSPAGPLERPQLAVLGQLKLCGPGRLSDLAARLGIDPSTVSRHVRRLEEAGLVIREADAADARATRLQVSATGEAALDEAHRLFVARLRTATSDWAEQDLDTLATLISRLAAAMTTQTNTAMERSA